MERKSAVMADKIDDGGPAFPQPALPPMFRATPMQIDAALLNTPGSILPIDAQPVSIELIGQGLSIRDYFAAAALQGMIASGIAPQGNISVISYEVADEMLAARKKGGS